MKTSHPGRFLLATALLLLAGCAEQSISDSSYESARYGGSNFRGGAGGGSRSYRGELNEMDVLGAPPGQAVSEADIRKALHGSGSVRARPGSSLLVVQSGAITPDVPMLNALAGEGYIAQPFSGLPPETPEERAEYSRKLRFAAAQGGQKHILCYWGVLESARENQVTKTVSWVPLVGGLVPDETQKMRINVRGALIDTETGRWTMVTGKSSENTALSSTALRESSHDKQVERLKISAYTSLADALAKAG